jgi:hypothetical protein
MKTAISVPDVVFERAQRHAARLGISRSEFFAKAAERWADELDGAELTIAIDRALSESGPDYELDFVDESARRLFTSDG